MRNALDFSYARPSGDQLASLQLDALGYTGNARPDQSYLDDLAAHGVGWTFIMETNSARSQEGYPAGVYDARFADGRSDQRNYPRDRSIAYVVSDGSRFDPASGGDQIADYGEGVAATSLRPFLFYGNQYAIDHATTGALRIPTARLLGYWGIATWGADRGVALLVQEPNIASPLPGTDYNSVYRNYTSAAPAPVHQEDDMAVYITKKSDTSVGVWVTDSQTRRWVNGDEWAFATFVGVKLLAISDQWWDSIPDINAAAGGSGPSPTPVPRPTHFTGTVDLHATP